MPAAFLVGMSPHSSGGAATTRTFCDAISKQCSGMFGQVAKAHSDVTTRSPFSAVDASAVSAKTTNCVASAELAATALRNRVKAILFNMGHKRAAQGCGSSGDGGFGRWVVGAAEPALERSSRTPQSC